MIEPPLAPPWKGGEHAALLRRASFLRPSLPLCKGESVGVVGKLKDKNISLFHDDSRFGDTCTTSERCRYFRPRDKRAIFENMTDAGTLVIGK